MSRKLALVAVLGASVIALAQSSAGSFSIGVTVVRGEHPECPVFIGSVMKNSPAAKSGVEPGDVLAAVDGTPVRFENAAQRIKSHGANPVRLSLRRGDSDSPVTVVVKPEPMAAIFRDNGLKIVEDGRVIPLDTTEEEVSCLLRFDASRIAGRVFRPTHYPENLSLYYLGFEAFMLTNPEQIAVGGIEQGPAYDAGVRWGDVVVSIDGMSVRGKTGTQLEAMLTSNTPRNITVAVERCGKKQTFSFTLQRATDIMRRNQKQAVGGAVMPLGIPRRYFSCFVEVAPDSR